jgi:hypothetical protein
VLTASARFLSLCFGPAARAYWPYSGVLLAALGAATAWLLVAVARREPAERLRVAGLVAVAAAIVSMALVAGIARGKNPLAAFAGRYVTLCTPLACVVYFAWLRYGSPALRRFVHASLYSLALALLFEQCAAVREQGADQPRLAHLAEAAQRGRGEALEVERRALARVLRGSAGGQTEQQRAEQAAGLCKVCGHLHRF